MSKLFSFDQNGFIKPYTKITCDLLTLEKIFVDQFPSSITRKRLFINYLRYIENFQSKVSNRFVQWIDGSFISQKENPKDIDFVTFLDYQVFEAQEPFLDKFWCFSLEDQGLDAYLVKVFSQSQEEYFTHTEKARGYWIDLYGSKKNVLGIEQPKGFLELKFE